MTFHSLDFLLFFVLVTAIYWRLPHRLQNVWLLAGSYVFYGYVHLWFLSLIVTTTVVDYWAALRMEARPDRKRLYLWASLAVNLGMLGFFKYFNFFIDNVSAVLDVIGLATSRPALAIVLPVGISFYTFQELTYTIDVYRGKLRARRSLLDVATFVAFFPQLVAGPIEPAARLLPQVEQPRRFSWPQARDAVFLVLWGYFKKLVVADNAGVIADKVFSLNEPGFTVLWAGVFAFGIQIYADFSAYSDIARGTARWLGIDLMRNFHHPYSARGLADFWHRWHISLSNWFRDYVYIPLGGSRGGAWLRSRNVLATFLLSGLWHGASWNFVLWGLFHGTLLVITKAVPPMPELRWKSLVIPAQIAGTFVLVNIGWLMFREADTSMLLRDLTLSPFATTELDRQAGMYLFLLAGLYSLPLWVHALWDELERTPRMASELGWIRHTPYGTALQTIVGGVLFAVLLVFRSRTSLDFIYFQF